MPSASAAPVVAGGEAAGIGPWEIEAVYKNDRFDRCAISRNLDEGLSVTFVRSGAGLTLLLASPHWKLEPGKSYPVTMKLGPKSWNREMGAEVSSVSMVVEDAKFVSGLRAANALDVVAAGDTIHVPLKGSAGAFERLNRCFEKNGLRLTSKPAPPVAKPEIGAETEAKAAEGTTASSQEESPPPPAAKPEAGTEAAAAGEDAGDAFASSEESPPPPAAKPEAGTEAAAAGEDAGDAVASSEESPPPPAAKPVARTETEDNAAEDAVASSEEESSPPPAAKPEKPVAKKASPKKKRSTQSSAQSAKRTFKREVDRLRRFFGN